MSTPKILLEPPCYLKNHSPKSLGRIRAISNKSHVLRDGIISEVYTYGQRGELLSVSKEENRDRLDAGLFPQQRSPGGDSFIQYLLNFDPGEVTLKADIMKLVSNKSKVYPELFDPDLRSAYYFSPGEGALNQFRTLKNSGDAEVLAVWKKIAPPGTRRVHFSGGQRHFDYDGNGNLIQERVERSTADYSYNARNRMTGVQMSRRGTVGLAGFESGSNTLSYTYDALGRRQSRTTSSGERTLYRCGDFGLNPMEERTQIGTIPMQLENDLRVDALNNAAPTRYRRCEPDVRPAVSGHRSRSFLIAGSRALAEIDGGGNQSYYTGDFHGTVQATFTVSGQLEDSYGYDVFGSPLEASIETDRRGYVGKPFDPLTGLYNYGYRDYRPELGRFTTVDPIRDGMNWYVYTGNDPVNHVDLWGLATEDGQKPADGYNVFSTVDGTYKGSQWDDPNNHNFGLGYYSSALDEKGNWHNDGHMNENSVKNNGLNHGDPVKKGDYLGRIETDENEDGDSSGPHVHHEKLEPDGEGGWDFVDPGPENPLGEGGKETAPYGEYPEDAPEHLRGKKHNGRDFAPK